MIDRAQKQAAGELVAACGFWGFGFVAAVWALRGGIGPNTVTALRLGIAGAISLLAIAAIPRFRKAATRDQVWLAAMPGLWMSLTLALQTWGLMYTTATKSGFVTTLYVLMVPLLERIIGKRKLPRGHFVAVAVAFFGTALICDFQGGEWNRGDLLTFGCAIAASFQIFWFGLIGDRIGDSFVFNGLQSLWAAPIPCAMALVLEKWPKQAPAPLAWAGLASLIFGSTLIAFMLQVRAQKRLRPSLASLIFLLESPFAAVFAMIFLAERLKQSQWIGAALILVAVVFAVRLDRPSDASAR